MTVPLEYLSTMCLFPWNDFFLRTISHRTSTRAYNSIISIQKDLGLFILLYLSQLDFF
jgi:hypothetical protein